MKKIQSCSILLCIFCLATLAGCGGHKQPAQSIAPPAENSVTESAKESETNGENSTNLPAQTASAEENTESPAPNGKATKPEAAQKSSGNMTSPKNTPPAQIPAPKLTDDSKTEKPEKPKNHPQTKPTSPPPTKPTDPPQTDPPKPTEPMKPAFKIDTWVAYAKSYAQNVGLTLDQGAVWCWDAPIVAGPSSKYLERDIQSRLNRYSRDVDITAVWVWAEPRVDGNYDLFIGYA